MQRIYLLKRPEDLVNYDEMRGIVLAAPNGLTARETAAEHAQDEGSAVWLNTKLSSMTIIGRCSGDTPKVFLTDIKEG